MRVSQAWVCQVVLMLLSSWLTVGQPNLQRAVVIEVIDGDSIQVRFPETNKVENVRYAAIAAPELKEPLGEQAREENRRLVARKAVWLELDPQNGGFRRDRNRRLLAYVYLDEAGKDMVNRRLVEQGYALLDVRGIIDRELRYNNFPVRYADSLIQAQIEAARKRKGWWGQTDPYRQAEVIIAAIKFWGEDETVYLLNRGKEKVDLAEGWSLSDPYPKRHKIDFGGIFSQEAGFLTPENLLRIHYGPVVRGKKRVKRSDAGDMDVYWLSATVWNNDRDKAWLRDPQGRDIYLFQYPPCFTPVTEDKKEREQGNREP